MSKEIGREGIDITKREGQEAEELGAKLIREGEGIKRETSAIQLEDEADQAIIENMPEQYQEAFNGEFESKVEPHREVIEETQEEVTKQMQTEVGKVQDGLGHLENASGISEVGREIAESGISELEKSSDEYENITGEEEEVANEAIQKIENNKTELGNILI